MLQNHDSKLKEVDRMINQFKSKLGKLGEEIAFDVAKIERKCNQAIQDIQDEIL